MAAGMSMRHTLQSSAVLVFGNSTDSCIAVMGALEFHLITPM
jgi:hypothetical protein